MIEEHLSDEPPVIPVGMDAYRMWDRWAQLRIGVRACMRSTRDRSGRNEAACASHYLYQERPDFNVYAHVEGPGVLYFTRANCWHGSPWHYETDGEDHVVAETATADPVMTAREHRWSEAPPPHTFVPAELFHEPLAWTWTTTRGADLNWMPVPFEKSLRLAHGRTCYGTCYCIYHRFAPDAPLSQPLRTFDWQTPPDADVVALLNSAGTDIAPAVGEDGTVAHDGVIRLRNGHVEEVFASQDGPGMLRALEISVPRDRAVDLGCCRLRMTWDDRRPAAVDAPLALFFGAANLFNGDDREYLVKALPMYIRFNDERAHLACYFPMPFFRSARIELIGRSGEPIDDVRFRVRTQPYAGPSNHVGYFHATYADHPQPRPGHDLVLLDTAEVGGGQWCGQFVGTSFIFTQQGNLNTLEAIPRFFFDDARMPQGYGTGTEEWGGGGDYWGGRNMTLPLAGHPCGSPSPQRKMHHKTGKETHTCENPIELVHSAYRFLLADLMPFGRRAVIRLEHGGENETNEHYETVTYWYGLPAASLVLTDELDIGDDASEALHSYAAPDASTPAQVTSRFELGVSELNGQEIYPAHTETERHHTSVSEFTLKLRPDNLGVMLRRRFDYLYPNQRAEVFIADEAGGDWQPAGTWFTPGASTSVFAWAKDKGNPESEVAEPLTEERPEDRRFYESEFFISRKLTERRKSICVHIQHVPDERPLWPDHPFPAEKSAWSEISYTAYCNVMPQVQD
jgi:D-arabinan exo alpha-(1,3)/(1,5)-arabinofuranosidase (non-reducing end)